MKKSFYVMLAFVAMSITNSLAQVVTIGSLDDPKATLDVRSKSSDVTVPDGIIAPKLTGDELFAKNGAYGSDQDNALVYVTAAASAGNQTGKTINVKAPGYYYFDSANDVWVAFATAKPEWFYMPSILIPVDTHDDAYNSDTSTFMIDLYAEYAAQLGSSPVQSSSATPLPVYPRTGLAYFVTYYDDAVFTNVNVYNSGIMTYKLVSSPAYSEKTYMNIIFQVIQ